MQMKLRHDVADSGKVDFANGEFTLYEMRGDRRFLVALVLQVAGDEARDLRVVVENGDVGWRIHR